MSLLFSVDKWHSYFSFVKSEQLHKTKTNLDEH